MSRSNGPEAPPVPTTRGRPFPNGNPGRKPGSKNRSTVLTSALLEGEAEELLRKAVALALDGDVLMLKFLLGRLLPKERPVRVDLPPYDGDLDPVDAMQAISAPPSAGRFHPVKRRRLQTSSQPMAAP
jgi:hypothetical protein